MKKNKLFIACDSKNISKVDEIISKTQNTKLDIGYKFGLEFLNSKKGRNFISKLKNKITFGDYKFADIPNTCASAIKAVKDLNFNYLTIHISSGLEALKAAKKVSGRTKLIGVTILTSLDNKSLKEVGYNKELKKIVLDQAKLANKAKLDAIVCSPMEVNFVKKVPIDLVDVKLSCETPKPKAPPSDLCNKITIINIIASIIFTNTSKLSMVLIYSNFLLYQ